MVDATGRPNLPASATHSSTSSTLLFAGPRQWVAPSMAHSMMTGSLPSVSMARSLAMPQGGKPRHYVD
jgi:hypothetical protein